ncbi:vesicle-associated membrane protein 2-like [Bradysia coprophila]|uniref:vesicle-associated membrane protein 2-like n=1 Tax=Bradysia coprophila TaxID=38358 RepID=UPI00187D8054|nr:vesicle-associated membrane protein 2-like [Bradysia coprophila]
MDIQNTVASTSNKLQHETTAQLVQKTQTEVDEIADIMRVNVVKVMERDHKLDDLNKRADALQQAASQFKLRSHKLKRKQCWTNVKMKIVLGVIGVIVLIVIFVFTWPEKDSTEDPSTTSATEDPSTTSTTVAP